MSRKAGGVKRAKSKNYSARIIARAVALLVAGNSVQAVADQLEIPQRTISEWKAQFPSDFAEIRTKREVVEDLLGQYLEETLRANLAQLKVFADESWIRTQTAGELATLHGVIFDKAVRILDAAHRAGEERRQLPAPGGDAAAGIVPETGT